MAISSAQYGGHVDLGKGFRESAAQMATTFTGLKQLQQQQNQFAATQFFNWAKEMSGQFNGGYKEMLTDPTIRQGFQDIMTKNLGMKGDTVAGYLDGLASGEQTPEELKKTVDAHFLKYGFRGMEEERGGQESPVQQTPVRQDVPTPQPPTPAPASGYQTGTVQAGAQGPGGTVPLQAAPPAQTPTPPQAPGKAIPPAMTPMAPGGGATMGQAAPREQYQIGGGPVDGVSGAAGAPRTPLTPGDTPEARAAALASAKEAAAAKEQTTFDYGEVKESGDGGYTLDLAPLNKRFQDSKAAGNPNVGDFTANQLYDDMFRRAGGDPADAKEREKYVALLKDANPALAASGGENRLHNMKQLTLPKWSPGTPEYQLITEVPKAQRRVVEAEYKKVQDIVEKVEQTPTNPGRQREFSRSVYYFYKDRGKKPYAGDALRRTAIDGPYRREMLSRIYGQPPADLPREEGDAWLAERFRSANYPNTGAIQEATAQAQLETAMADGMIKKMHLDYYLQNGGMPGDGESPLKELELRGKIALNEARLVGQQSANRVALGTEGAEIEQGSTEHKMKTIAIKRGIELVEGAQEGLTTPDAYAQWYLRLPDADQRAIDAYNASMATSMGLELNYEKYEEQRGLGAKAAAGFQGLLHFLTMGMADSPKGPVSGQVPRVPGTGGQPAPGAAGDPALQDQAVIDTLEKFGFGVK